MATGSSAGAAIETGRAAPAGAAQSSAAVRSAAARQAAARRPQHDRAASAYSRARCR